MSDAEALLGITLPAPVEDIKRAYRRQISRYHPDKVHHLGEEFQEMAAAKSAQLTEVYQRLVAAGGVDSERQRIRVSEEESGGPGVAASYDHEERQGASNLRNGRTSTWQAVANACPSLILEAAIERVRQAVRSMPTQVEETEAAGCSCAWRTRPGWGALFTRKTAQGILLRTPADASHGATRVRHLLTGVHGTIVLLDLVLGLPGENAAGRKTTSRPDPDVVVVAVDAMTFKTRVPDDPPDLLHQILTRLHDASA